MKGMTDAIAAKEWMAKKMTVEDEGSSGIETVEQEQEQEGKAKPRHAHPLQFGANAGANGQPISLDCLEPSLIFCSLGFG